MTTIIEWFRFFLSLSDTLSFSTSAEDMHVSQPTLSKSIRGLENELGVTLFNRNTRNVSLTKEGKSLIPYAKKIVDSYKEMDIYLQQHLKSINYMLNVATLPVLHLYGISNAMMNYKSENPEINLKLAEADMFTTIKKIYEEAIDVAIVRDCCLKHLKDFTIHHTFDDELAVLCHKSHPLANAKEVSLSRLTSESFIFINKGEDEYREALAPFGHDNLLIDNVVATVSSTTALYQFVYLRFGISILSRNVCKRIIAENGYDKDMVILPIKEHPPFSLHVGTPMENPSSEAMKFITFIKNQLE